MKKHFILFLILLSTLLFAQQNYEHLTATIIGSGSPKFNTERSGPSVLVSYKNTQILVDMGNGTQANLHKNNTKIKDIDGLLVFTDGYVEGSVMLPRCKKKPIFMINEGGDDKYVKTLGNVFHVDIPHSTRGGV